MGASGTSLVELLGGPHGAPHQAQARPALQLTVGSLTNGVHEAPYFSGSDGAFTLLSFFLLSCFLFPEAEAKENHKPQPPHTQESSGTWRSL